MNGATLGPAARATALLGFASTYRTAPTVALERALDALGDALAAGARPSDAILDAQHALRPSRVRRLGVARSRAPAARYLGIPEARAA